MSMTDPVADMLTRIRNANMSHTELIEMPSSKLKVAVAEVLKKEGYIRDFLVEPTTPQPTLKMALKFTKDRRRVITGIKRISKPGLRVYSSAKDMPRVLGGLGIAIVSTSQGLLTDRDARRNNVGGEILAHVW